MIVAEIFYPDVASDEIKCIECELSYRKKDYELLYAAWKVKYFFISSTSVKYDRRKPDLIVCHNCLFEILKDLNKEVKSKTIRFKILTKSQEVELQYDSEATNDLNQSTNMDDFLSGLDAIEGDTDEMTPREGDYPDWGA